MKNLALPRIQKMEPYNPPLSGRRTYRGMLLDFNERTMPQFANVEKSIQRFLSTNTIQIYPEYGYLENKLAQYTGAKKNQILITNGSDQAIDLIFRTFTDTNDTVVIPTPSFAMFYQSAQIVGSTILSPRYTKKDLSFPLNEIRALLNNTMKLVVICNPNNPTGTLVAIKDIESIAKQSPNTIVLVDEAYFEFSKTSAISLIEQFPNIIVTRTLSKAFGLPSLRLGYIVAAKKYITELAKVRGPYDINMVAYTASLAALDNRQRVEKYVNEVMNQSKPMVEEFFSKNGIRFYQSAGNFILYKQVIQQEVAILKKNGILVRPQNKPTIQNTLRLTIGTIKQMKQFIAVYQKAILNRGFKKYAFLDRDGTLIYEPQDTFQIDRIEKLKVLDGVIQGLKKLKKQGFELVMISNQDGLGTPSFPKTDFVRVQNTLLNIFKKNGITFTKIYICPHMVQDNCTCRKPKTNLVANLLEQNVIDKNSSFVCGDRKTDRQFATNIGISFISMQTNGNLYTAFQKGGII